jgi:hypothetical protein
MAQWRKVVVAGSSPEFNGATLSGDLTVAGGDIVLGSTSIFSGGDTAQLNNIDALDATTEATIESAIDTLSNLTAASSLVTVSTLGSGAISSGFGNIDIGTSTFNAGNSTVDTLVNDSSVAASRITGSFSGSFVGDGSQLAGVAQDIDTLNAYGAATLHQTQDKFLVSDNGTEKSITFSNMQDSIFADVSGDATIAAGGALTLASNSVSQAQLDDDAVGADELAADAVVNASIASNAAIDMDKLDGDSLAGTLTDFDQDDLVILSDTDDSGDLKKMTTSNFEDAIFGNVSGDATVAAGGALTIAATSVEGSMLNDNVISGQGALGSAAVAQADLLLIDDGPGTIKSVTFSNFEDSIFGNVSGDVSIAAGGVATVTGASTNAALTAGVGLSTTNGTFNGASAVTFALDLSELSDVQIASGDKLAVLDSDNSTEQLESIDDIATLMAGDALAASSAVLAVQVDDTTIETNSDALRAKTAAISDGGSGLATADQIHTFYTAGGSNLATAFNTDLGGDFIIGNQSSDTATFSGAVTITGNLDVNGTLTTIDSTNLRVADRFIYASSGSTNGDGGLIVGTGAAGVGTALGYDDSASRWALTKADDTAEDATSITPRQYVVSVSGSAADASSNPSDFGSSATDRIGMMHVNTSTGDIFIFS